jgi:hypothetical protein
LREIKAVVAALKDEFKSNPADQCRTVGYVFACARAYESFKLLAEQWE